MQPSPRTPKLVKCPICKTPSPWQGNPNRPFCSERCKLIDLGKWADGSYGVEAVEESPSEPFEPGT